MFAGALLITACKKAPEPEGGPCSNRYQCQRHLSCIAGSCQPHRQEEQRCDGRNVMCQSGLVCHEDVCRTPTWVEREQQRRAQKANASLLKQSGVAPESPAAEAQPAPPGSGARVRVSRTESVRRGFAACRPNERLLGGGCESPARITRSAPAQFGEDDTVGARWVCETGHDSPVVSFALCQALPSDASGAGSP